MEKEALLTFNDLVDRYAKHRGFIERARSQGSKFSAAAIEKVVSDHSLKANEVAGEILPYVPRIEDRVSALEAERGKIAGEQASVNEQMEELQLRLEIEEIDQAEFDSLSEDFRSALNHSEARSSGLLAEQNELSAALTRWVDLARSAGAADGRRGAPPVAAPAPAPAPVAQAAPAPQAAPVQVDAPTQVEEEDAGDNASQDDDGVMRGGREDLSEVFAQTSTLVITPPEEESVGAIEAADVVDEELAEEPSADVDFGFDDQGASDELLRKGGGAEVELDLVEDPETHVAREEVAVELSAPGPAQVNARGAGTEEARRALLLYQEGTAEEAIYPFTGEVLTIGRGRDNDIQIKNDSKVSRFHCKLFRQGAAYYIEDNKSSNGTLVNGELITERRLFGGEEVIIGETYFRFRIL